MQGGGSSQKAKILIMRELNTWIVINTVLIYPIGTILHVLLHKLSKIEYIRSFPFDWFEEEILGPGICSVG